MVKMPDVKCVIWDLDDTVWHGTLIENDQLVLKDNVVEIFQELDQRGILNSIASKNNQEDAMAVLDKFGLSDFFVYPQIHWGAKSKSIEVISRSLNLDLNTFLFIDDQAFERDEVSTCFSQVECMDAVQYQTITAMARLNPRFITQDSKRRRLMYLQDQGRKQAEEEFEGPSAEFLASLEMRFNISIAGKEDLKRAEELTVRTNQLNATGVTYSYDELEHFRTASNYELLICELTDRYGSYGKIGLALIEKTQTHFHIRLLLMSCRVMARGVGTVLLSHIQKIAKEHNKKLLADFRQTDKNKQMYITYRFANFKEVEADAGEQILLENDCEFIQDYPQYIQVNA